MYSTKPHALRRNSNKHSFTKPWYDREHTILWPKIKQAFTAYKHNDFSVLPCDVPAGGGSLQIRQQSSLAKMNITWIGTVVDASCGPQAEWTMTKTTWDGGALVWRLVMSVKGLHFSRQLIHNRPSQGHRITTWQHRHAVQLNWNHHILRESIFHPSFIHSATVFVKDQDWWDHGF